MVEGYFIPVSIPIESTCPKMLTCWLTALCIPTYHQGMKTCSSARISVMCMVNSRMHTRMAIQYCLVSRELKQSHRSIN